MPIRFQNEICSYIYAEKPKEYLTIQKLQFHREGSVFVQSYGWKSVEKCAKNTIAWLYKREFYCIFVFLSHMQEMKWRFVIICIVQFKKKDTKALRSTLCGQCIECRLTHKLNDTFYIAISVMIYNDTTNLEELRWP